MSDKLKKVAPGKVEITVAASKEEWQKAKDKAFNKLAAKVTVKGFRPGKAPKAELAKGVNPDQLNNEAINNILPVLYSKALEEEKVTPFLQPNVEITKFSSDDFEAKFTIVIAPSVKLGAYKDLHAEKEAPSVSDKEVEDAVNSQLQGAATLEVVDREAKMGDTVTFDFEGFVDGKPFDGGKAENYSLELGSHSFVPGFEEGLVGVKSGDAKDVEITFPENYVKELASKKAVFKCKVHEIKEKKVPELNDEAVKDLAIPGVETVDALKALASWMDAHGLEVLHSSTQIIIAPGYDYKIVKMLVTNFHQPQSTLLLLVSAFVHGDWHKIYDYALSHDFRFLSYGDSSLLIP
jgi:trigger factor